MQQAERNKTTAGRADKKRMTVIQVQGFFCALALAALLLCRALLPTRFGQIELAYTALLGQQEVDVEPARFASALLKDLFVPAAAAAAAPQGASSKSFVPQQAYVQPVAGAALSSGYGWRKHPVTGKRTFHRGVDLACAEGTPIVAAMDGDVAYTLYSASGGNCVRLRHQNGVESVYCHMQYAFVRAGETVTAGQVIGTAGSTGNATGPHLHFSLLKDDCYYDPSKMLGLY